MHSNDEFNEFSALIDLRQMRHVVVLAQSGSYVAAAQALGLTQSALTRSIQAAEAHYGVRLFDRGRGGAVLTDAGHAFVDRAEALLADARILDQSMLEQRAGIAGEVRFGLGPLIASAVLAGAIPPIMADFPAIELRASVAGGGSLLEQLIANGLQFAICSSATLAPSAAVPVTPLGLLPLCVVVRASHPLAGRRVTRDEARAFPLIGGTAEERPRDGSADYRPQLACDNYEILRGIVRESDAMWVTSPAVVPAELADGHMARVECPALVGESYEVVLVTRRRGAMSRAAAMVADRLRAQLTPHLGSAATVA